MNRVGKDVVLYISDFIGDIQSLLSFWKATKDDRIVTRFFPMEFVQNHLLKSFEPGKKIVHPKKKQKQGFLKTLYTPLEVSIRLARIENISVRSALKRSTRVHLVLELPDDQSRIMHRLQTMMCASMWNNYRCMAYKIKINLPKYMTRDCNVLVFDRNAYYWDDPRHVFLGENVLQLTKHNFERIKCEYGENETIFVVNEPLTNLVLRCIGTTRTGPVWSLVVT